MSNKKRKRKGTKRRRSGSSTLLDHRKSGRRLTPPLLDVQNLSTPTWLKDTFPDLLWMCSVITSDAKEGIYRVGRFVDVFNDILEKNASDAVVDGRLTSFDGVTDDLRAEVLDRLVEVDVYFEGVPEPTYQLLRLYEDRPGAWILGPWEARDLKPELALAEAHLNQVLEQAWHGQNEVPTSAKMMVLRSLMTRGKLKLPGHLEDFELLAKWPDHLGGSDKAKIESLMRATFSAIVGGESLISPESAAAAEAWCRAFWRSNWYLYSCRTEPPAQQQDDHPSEDESSRFPADLAKGATDVLQATIDAASKADPDLYDPDRFEVLTGIAMRSARLAAAATAVPTLWHGEFGSPTLRAIVECHIVLAWLLNAESAENDVYAKYKAFGLGRMKWMKLQIDELLESRENPEESLVQYAEALEAEVNADGWEELLPIDLAGTFSGKSMNKMAEESGLDELYNFAFAPASGSSHGDWPSLDRYVLQRCQNLAHGGHRVARTNLAPESGELAVMMLSLAEETLELYIRALGVGAAPESPDEEE